MLEVEIAVVLKNLVRRAACPPREGRIGTVGQAGWARDGDHAPFPERIPPNHPKNPTCNLFRALGSRRRGRLAEAGSWRESIRAAYRADSAGFVAEDSFRFDPTFGAPRDPQMLQVGVGLALGHRSPTAGLEELL